MWFLPSQTQQGVARLTPVSPTVHFRVKKNNNLYFKRYLSLQPCYHLQPCYPSLNPVTPTFSYIILKNALKSNLMFVDICLKC